MKKKIEKIMGVYSIVNCKNGKIYIGSSIDINRRFGEHKLRLAKNKHPNSHLQSAWNLDSKDNFSFAILQIVTNKKDLLVCEQKFIDNTKSYMKEFGYNLSPSAENTLGYRHKEETKEKMRNSWDYRVPHSIIGIDKKVEEIIDLFIIGKSVSYLSETFNASQDTIRNILRRKRWISVKISAEKSELLIIKWKEYKNSSKFKVKLNQEKAIDIRRKFNQGITIKKLSKEYNVACATISKVVKGIRWKDVKIDGS